MSVSKYVYNFSSPKAEGDKSMKHVLGGKGANLAEMINIGIPVPPGFTISTHVCDIYSRTGAVPQAVVDQIEASIKHTEQAIGKEFGNPSNPLLFSVRSGAAASMPGMMDTVLNLGLNDATVAQLVGKGDVMARFAYDSYRRFITMYADVVMQLGREQFEHAIDHMKAKRGIKYDAEFTAADLRELVAQFKALYEKLAKGQTFPQDPRTQLYASINAVFRSWNNPRANKYRQLYHISGLIGTAVNVQSMVFGNMSNDSATGVAFSRSPSDGTNFFYGEYLINAQGEDVVAGLRTPQQISVTMSKKWALDNGVSEQERVLKYPSMEEAMPKCYKQLVWVRETLEHHFRDMQDMEFTVENGNFYMLQTRNGKRTMKAAVKIAVDMVKEGMIDEKEAVMRIDPAQVDHLLHPYLDPNVKAKPVAKGLPASPGAACGQIVFSAPDAVAWQAQGKKVVMIRLETSPEDLAGMHAAEGFVTARGGMTSHAAVVARGMGRTCVAGCADLTINQAAKTCDFKGVQFKEGDFITIDGTKGLVFKGVLPLHKPGVEGDFETILTWCKKFKRLGVRANADTPNDAKVAFNFGAEGVGLCRTEHMFFEADRIDAIREMILANDEAGRKAALAKVLPLQRKDFIGIMVEMKGQPCTIRLLDPPLHEFVPHDPKAQAELAAKLGVAVAHVAKRVKELHEENPMLGHRGCRLGISYPEIYNMQVQAIIEAAIEVSKSHPAFKPAPEIMIPLVGKKSELAFSKQQAVLTAEGILQAHGLQGKLHYSVGTMIEVPRAAITADEIASEAEFFSFGTNDLTQMGCGFSRDDSAVFLRKYIELGIYDRDPFQSIDEAGVGQLVEIAVKKGRSVNPMLKCGVCGEHGGDPKSISFFHKVGLNYVSCSPYRVPVAIVAAGRAAVAEERKITEQRKALLNSKI
jgi:pyruvate,orthophosphate dikinase